tara:strand:- start:104 stop:460 length:357 start_codon:yes stop_codon:yes gene_type:complete
MNKYLLFLLLLFPITAKANTVTPAFTQGSMNSTTNSTQNIVETIQTNVYGGDYSSWTGHNITPTGHINDHATSFDITTPGANFQLEIVNRAAGIIEVTDINRTIDTTSTTTSLSVFSQ